MTQPAIQLQPLRGQVAHCLRKHSQIERFFNKHIAESNAVEVRGGKWR